MGGALSRLTWKQVAVIGVVFCAILAGLLYWLLIRKQLEEIQTARSTLTKTQQEAEGLAAAKKELDDAKAARQAVIRRLAVYERTKMIPLSLATPVDRYHTMVRLWHEHADVLGPLMERHIGSTGLESANVTPIFANLLTGEQFEFTTGMRPISVPRAPDRPNAISAPGGWYRVPIGTVTMRTTEGLPQVYAFLRSFTRAPRLVAVGAPTIRGESPYLTVSVPLEVYYLVKGVPAGGAPAGGMGVGGPGMVEPGMMPGGAPPGMEMGAPVEPGGAPPPP